VVVSSSSSPSVVSSSSPRVVSSSSSPVGLSAAGPVQAQTSRAKARGLRGMGSLQLSL
jgi:hypothetical protein